MKKILITFILTCAISVGGIWLGVQHGGFWSALGWVVAVVFGLIALKTVSVLLRIIRWHHGAEQRLQELGQRDAELFAQGKSFDEVIAQYKKPKS